VVDEEQQLIAKLRIRARLATLEAVERPIEYRFSLADPWSRSLFIAILRRHPALRVRQRAGSHGRGAVDRSGDPAAACV